MIPATLIILILAAISGVAIMGFLVAQVLSGKNQFKTIQKLEKEIDRLVESHGNPLVQALELLSHFNHDDRHDVTPVEFIRNLMNSVPTTSQSSQSEPEQFTRQETQPIDSQEDMSGLDDITRLLKADLSTNPMNPMTNPLAAIQREEQEALADQLWINQKGWIPAVPPSVTPPENYPDDPTELSREEIAEMSEQLLREVESTYRKVYRAQIQARSRSHTIPK